MLFSRGKGNCHILLKKIIHKEIKPFILFHVLPEQPIKTKTMKTWILALVLMLGISANAQNKKESIESLKPEERVALQVKKLTATLDLTDKQQKDITKLLLKNDKERQEAMAALKVSKSENRKKLTDSERLAMKNRALEVKAEMRKILTKKQIEKLDKINAKEYSETKQIMANVQKKQ